MSVSEMATRRGMMFILSSPSGAGKTTLSRKLLECEADLELSVSVTTRPARPGEVDGVDYHFIAEQEFMELKQRGELLEWAKVFDNYYGTPAKRVEDVLSKGHDLLFDIDWQGAKQLKEKAPLDMVGVFILPPSGAALEQRLHKRAQDSVEVVKRRMAGASNEIKHWDEYDYVVINEDLDHSLTVLRQIMQAERFKRHRQNKLAGFVDTIQQELQQALP